MIDFGFEVKLGPMSFVDKERAFQWRNNPAIYKWCRQFEPLQYANHERWFDSLPERTDVRMYTILKEINTEYSHTLEAVGVCGLTSIDHINRHAEFSLYIDPARHGKGYGERALRTLCAHGFLALGLNHIFGETFDGNPAAHLFEKVGFRKEGTRHQFYFREGKFIDAHLYAVTADEFRGKWNI